MNKAHKWLTENGFKLSPERSTVIYFHISEMTV